MKHKESSLTLVSEFQSFIDTGRCSTGDASSELSCGKYVANFLFPSGVWSFSF